MPAPPAACGPRPAAAPAAKLITEFSRPGDLVAALDGCPWVIEAATTSGRRVLALTSGDPDDEQKIAGLALRSAPAAGVRTASLSQLLAPGDPAAGQAALAITGCRHPGCHPAPGPEAPAAGLVHAAAHRVLTPGGILAVITASHAPDDGRLTDPAGNTVAAARAAGLIYTQHIVLVHAAIRDDHLDPGTTRPPGQPGGSPVHSDLLLFSKIGSRSA
jgi:hypothetical protein